MENYSQCPQCGAMFAQNSTFGHHCGTYISQQAYAGAIMADEVKDYSGHINFDNGIVKMNREDLKKIYEIGLDNLVNAHKENQRLRSALEKIIKQVEPTLKKSVFNWTLFKDRIVSVAKAALDGEGSKDK